MISSSGLLTDTLRQHQLLTPAQLAELPQLAPGRCSDARTLAKALISKPMDALLNDLRQRGAAGDDRD